MTRKKELNNEIAHVNRMSHPSLLVLGNGPSADQVADRVEQMRAALTVRQWSDESVRELKETFTAAVLVLPLERTSTAHAVHIIRGSPSGKEIPLFTVFTSAPPEREIRRLYEEGINAVFEWPEDAEALPYCLAELVVTELVQGKTSDPDKALARAVDAQIRTRCSFHHSVRVRVVDGAAFLYGSTDQLWQKQRIKEVAGSLPGLKGVIDRDVFVLPTGVSDEEVSEGIRRMVRGISDIDEKTLAIRVENGYVTLAGSMEDRTEVKRLTRLISNLRGVRDITPLIVVSPSQKQQDHRIAKQLQSSLRRLFIDEDASVSFFGNTAVLSGSVSSPFIKQRISQIVQDEVHVDRIVNKIRVNTSNPENTPAP